MNNDQLLMNRKSVKKLRFINWSIFPNTTMMVEGSTLLTGGNTTGKSTALDGFNYLLTGNTSFNAASTDKNKSSDRTLVTYLRGDTTRDGDNRYLRGNRDVTCYIGAEFDSPVDKEPMVIFVAIELSNESSTTSSYWYIAKNTSMDEIKFCDEEGGKLTVYPKRDVKIKGQRITHGNYLSRDKGLQQVLQALGLRGKVSAYRNKLTKMMAFNPDEKNVDAFIRNMVLDANSISSIAELKEQRDSYNNALQEYENMLLCRKKLEEIEDCTKEYEKAYDGYQTRNILFSYQNWKKLLSDSVTTKDKKSAEEAKVADLKKRKISAEEERDVAWREYDELRNKNSDITRSIENFDKKIKELKADTEHLTKASANLKSLQDFVNEVIGMYSEEMLHPGNRHNVTHLISADLDPSLKASSFHIFAQDIDALIENKRNKKSENYLALRNVRDMLRDRRTTRHSLEQNKLVFESSYIKTRELLEGEMSKRGIVTDVKFFVELIADIKDKKWQKAIEAYLNTKRFDIIVEPKYAKLAMQIISENRNCRGSVIITDKLEKTDIIAGSAAEQLEIANPSARMYANYLLNRIHLCKDIDELHEYPKGGLMSNGTLAKSYAVRNLEMDRLNLYIGQDAVKSQLEQLSREIESLEKEESVCISNDEALKDEIAELTSIPLRQDDYEFDAISRLVSVKEELRKTEDSKREYENNPSFAAITNAIKNAEDKYNSKNLIVSQIDSTIGASVSDINKYETKLVQIAEDEVKARNKFEDDIREKPEFKQPAIDMYEQLLKKKTPFPYITLETIHGWETRMIDSKHKLENQHREYCQLEGTSKDKYGIQYINHYRDIHRKLINVRIEEASQKVEKMNEKLQDAFAHDFIIKIRAAAQEARENISALNKVLRKRKFGDNIYEFEMNENHRDPRRDLFFRIAKRLPEPEDAEMEDMYSLFNPGKNTESRLSEAETKEYERDIKEFIDIVLKEEDESVYTDYRNYYNYDVHIIDIGESEGSTHFSKKKGSASGGELQTPYYIILAAALLQFYPEDRCCARIAFVDEAFSKMDPERISQMVDYFEENGFQTFYAAPPEKINSIGTRINTTISIMKKGDYSFAIEGLEKSYAQRAKEAEDEENGA